MEFVSISSPTLKGMLLCLEIAIVTIPVVALPRMLYKKFGALHLVSRQTAYILYLCLLDVLRNLRFYANSNFLRPNGGYAKFATLFPKQKLSEHNACSTLT